jgi:hypothetical protein
VTFMLVGLVPGYVVITEFLATGLVPRFPSAILAAALELAGIVLLAVGLVLSSLSRRFQELESKLDMMSIGWREAANSAPRSTGEEEGRSDQPPG